MPYLEIIPDFVALQTIVFAVEKLVFDVIVLFFVLVLKLYPERICQTQCQRKSIYYNKHVFIRGN